MMRLTALLLVLCFICPALSMADAATEITLDTTDGPRHALLLPAGDGPRPTVIVLHGALGTGAKLARDSGFAEAAAAHGFTAVFPDGVRRQWHDGRTGGSDGPDDVAFLRALVARLIADQIAIPSHLYLAGISNGGMMTFTMACKTGDLFAGIGTVIANMPDGITPCRPHPMPVVMINGTRDPVVPYNGGVINLHRPRGLVWSVAQTLDLFTRLDGCGTARSTALPDSDPGDGSTVTRITWTGCHPGTSVTQYRIDGGGHALPGNHARTPAVLGPVNRDISGATLIMDVFAQP